MGKAQKFTASYAGRVVGTRSSKTMTYAFAIVAQHNEAKARKAAYEFADNDHERRHFDYMVACANGTHAHSQWASGLGRGMTVGERYAAELAEFGGTCEGYIAKRRGEMIAHFESNLAAGHFEPHVAAWSQTRHNAEKAAGQLANNGHNVLAIVPAVPV